MSLLAGMMSWVFLEWLATPYPADLIAACIGLVTLVLVTIATSQRFEPLPLCDVDGSLIVCHRPYPVHS